MNGPVLVVGGTGLLGPWLVDAARQLGEVVTAARHGADVELDITDGAAVARTVQRLGPALVLHLAALTDVDACEADPPRADAVNHLAVAHLAQALPAAARLVLVSTDQVYPDVPGPHGEERTGPVNAYGRSKLLGEQAALRRPGTLVVRTNFFGPSRTPGRESLSDWVIARLRAAEPLPLFVDSTFNPLHMATLSDLLVELVERELTGVVNAGSRDGATKHDFGLAVARHLGVLTTHAVPTVSATLPGRAPRPSDLRTDVSRLETVLGRPLPSIADEIIGL